MGGGEWQGSVAVLTQSVGGSRTKTRTKHYSSPYRVRAGVRVRYIPPEMLTMECKPVTVLVAGTSVLLHQCHPRTETRL